MSKLTLEDLYIKDSKKIVSQALLKESNVNGQTVQLLYSIDVCKSMWTEEYRSYPDYTVVWVDKKGNEQSFTCIDVLYAIEKYNWVLTKYEEWIK